MESEIKKKEFSSPLGNFSLHLKFWIQGEGDFTIGKGDIKLLSELKRTQNLTQATKSLNYSYKYGWDKLRKISKKTGKKVVITKKGGAGGGGMVELTEWGKYLLHLYEIISKDVDNFLIHESEKMKEFSKKKIFE
ncbi:MAG: hypothetical protein K9W44_08535 [Candidatus Lokiarchaeota archaeon]|nr:hypothetical protein [Candidatus Harpocratesius repetitus]